jgi:hypothetical protein
MAQSRTRATDKSSAGRRARNRGRAYEESVARFLGGHLVPGSGQYRSRYHKATNGDVEWNGLKIQCKRTSALKTQRKWLTQDNCDILFQAEPGQHVHNSLVVMTAKTFKQLMEGRHADTP